MIFAEARESFPLAQAFQRTRVFSLLEFPLSSHSEFGIGPRIDWRCRARQKMILPSGSNSEQIEGPPEPQLGFASRKPNPNAHSLSPS